jgi:DNA-binding LacI/PurR family transcriptional regulator
MHVDMYEVGKKAMNMLTELLGESLENKQFKFESVFQKRKSTL